MKAIAIATIFAIVAFASPTQAAWTDWKLTSDYDDISDNQRHGIFTESRDFFTLILCVQPGSLQPDDAATQYRQVIEFDDSKYLGDTFDPVEMIVKHGDDKPYLAPGWYASHAGRNWVSQEIEAENFAEYLANLDRPTSYRATGRSGDRDTIRDMPPVPPALAKRLVDTCAETD